MPRQPGASREALAPLFARDGLAVMRGGSTAAAVVQENRDVLSYTPAYRSAFRHLHIWLDGGPPPPLQARIEFESADPPTIRRDQYANALGGVRLPDFAVPIGEHRGRNDGDLHESLAWYSRPFTAGNCMGSTLTGRRISAGGTLRSTVVSTRGSSCPRTRRR